MAMAMATAMAMAMAMAMDLPDAIIGADHNSRERPAF
jgi:hypothetical protein